MGLDAVELVMQWEESFEIEFGDDEAEEIETPEMAIAFISAKVNASTSDIGICPIMRAFHRVREVFQTTLNLERQQVRPTTKLRDLLPKKQRREVWNQLCSDICASLEIPKLPGWGLGTCVLFDPITIQDLVDWIVIHYPKGFIDSQTGWTHFQVRSVARAAVREATGVGEFKDNCRFIELSI
ncbi:MAG: hypothetical protein SW833_15700 [Cyanobacteriota bacterium]|nr:hypothetical protein [Cyanobacteriota bacterium]